VGAIGRFASSVSEALAFGSPLASILGQQASAIREEQRMQMEEQIEKVPVKMLVPMGTLIVPAMLLAILGPLLSAALRLG
jgi:tight adherence protein C